MAFRCLCLPIGIEIELIADKRRNPSISRQRVKVVAPILIGRLTLMHHGGKDNVDGFSAPHGVVPDLPSHANFLTCFTI